MVDVSVKFEYLAEARDLKWKGASESSRREPAP